jgi:hypothetical protein
VNKRQKKQKQGHKEAETNTGEEVQAENKLKQQ